MRMPGIGRRIRLCRQRQGLSRFELGQLCGVDGHFIYRWEREVVVPRLDSVAKLARALRITIDWLVTGIGEKSGDESRKVSRRNRNTDVLKSSNAKG
jgi:transcriptional regulator with XRE-family HTH domain